MPASTLLANANALHLLCVCSLWALHTTHTHFRLHVTDKFASAADLLYFLFFSPFSLFSLPIIDRERILLLLHPSPLQFFSFSTVNLNIYSKSQLSTTVWLAATSSSFILSSLFCCYSAAAFKFCLPLAANNWRERIFLLLVFLFVHSFYFSPFPLLVLLPFASFEGCCCCFLSPAECSIFRLSKLSPFLALTLTYTLVSTSVYFCLLGTETAAAAAVAAAV